MRLSTFTVLYSLSSFAGADTVHLVSGKAVQGMVVQESAAQVQVETAAGIMKFSAGEVARVERDNSQVVGSLQKLVESGQGAEAVNRISRLDRSRFSANELATVDQLAAQVNQSEALNTAQLVHQQDMKTVSEAAEIYQRLGWRESAAHLEKACAASQHPLYNSQVALVELYAANATYPEAMDFAPTAEKFCSANAPTVYASALQGARQKFDGQVARLKVEKQNRDEAFAPAGDARARLEQAAHQRAQVAAIQGARIAAAKPELFKPKTADAGKIQKANEARKAALTKEAMDKAGVQFNCQGGICPSR